MPGLASRRGPAQPMLYGPHHPSQPSVIVGRRRRVRYLGRNAVFFTPLRENPGVSGDARMLRRSIIQTATLYDPVANFTEGIDVPAPIPSFSSIISAYQPGISAP